MSMSITPTALYLCDTIALHGSNIIHTAVEMSWKRYLRSFNTGRRYAFIREILTSTISKPLTLYVVDNGDNEYEIGRKYIFGIPGEVTSYELQYTGTICPDTLKVVGTLWLRRSTGDLDKKIDSKGMVVSFRDIDDALEYLDNIDTTFDRSSTVHRLRPGDEIKPIKPLRNK